MNSRDELKSAAAKHELPFVPLDAEGKPVFNSTRGRVVKIVDGAIYEADMHLTE